MQTPPRRHVQLASRLHAADLAQEGIAHARSSAGTLNFQLKRGQLAMFDCMPVRRRGLCSSTDVRSHVRNLSDSLGLPSTLRSTTVG